LGERSQKVEGTGEGNHAYDVFDLAELDFAIFGVVVGVGEELADGGEAGAAMGLADDFFGDEAMLVGPGRPDACDGGSGVDEDAVEIEEHTAAENFHAVMIPSFVA
jgi:hypothetical protein